MNNLKKKHLLVIALFLHYGLQAQQFPVVTQYMQTPTFLNPGATGANEQNHIQLLHRSQWVGYDTYDNTAGTAPELQLFTAAFRPKSRRDSIDSTGRIVHTFVKPARHGFGAVLMRDKAASLTTVEGKISYAYHIPFSRKSMLAFGMQAGMQFQSIDYAKFRVLHPDDPWLPDQGKITQGRPVLMLGLWYEHEAYYIGLAADGITESVLDELGINPNRNWTFTAGYHFAGTKGWKVSPSLMAISNSEEYLLAAGINVTYLNVFSGGLTYRHEEAASAMLGIGMLEQRRLYLNYAIDYITQNAGIKSNTSHEVMIGYRWK
jgi:type IX secretion system PorP/SprF family membrane protein